MGNKLTPKVILEGTRLTFKTEIAFELNEHPRVVGPRKYRYHSPLISAEWCTFTNCICQIKDEPCEACNEAHDPFRQPSQGCCMLTQKSYNFATKARYEWMRLQPVA